MIRQYYEEWPDDCARQAYPFTGGDSRSDTTRELTIQNEHVLDARLWPPRVGGGRLYLQSIVRSSGGLTITISDLDGPSMVANIDTNHLGAEKVVFRHVSNNSVCGWMRFARGALANLYDHPIGEYRFTTASTEFAAIVVSAVAPGGVTALQVGKTRLSGDVLLFGGRGVDLEVVSGYLIVNAVGDPYARRDRCADPVYSGALLNPVRAIRVIDKTSGGSFLVKPVGGTLLSTVIKGEREIDGQKADAYQSPGPNGELLVRSV